MKQNKQHRDIDWFTLDNTLKLKCNKCNHKEEIFKHCVEIDVIHHTVRFSKSTTLPNCQKCDGLMKMR